MAEAQDTRERLLEAARDLIVEGGLSALSMRAVAKDVGVSAPAIYRHFENKEALIVALLDEGFTRFSQYLWRALEADAPLDRLRLAGLQYARFGIEHGPYYRLMFLTPCEELGYDELSESNQESASPTFQFLVDRVRECMDAGVIASCDPQSVSFTVWSHVHGLVSLYLMGQTGSIFCDDEAFLAFVETSISRLFAGLATSR